MRIVLATLLLVCGQAALAGNCPGPKPDQTWSADCFSVTAQGRMLKPAYRKRLRLDRSGHEVVTIEKQPGGIGEVAALDRLGRVVVPNIRVAGDFDYPYAPAHMARFYEQTDGARMRCGYFNSKRFQIVIPAIYDQCQAFHDGMAHVCTDCASYCLDQDCHSSELIGGVHRKLDANNRLITTDGAGSFEQACAGRPYRVEQRSPGYGFLFCSADKKAAQD